jgi:hypothetical protein
MTARPPQLPLLVMAVIALLLNCGPSNVTRCTTTADCPRTLVCAATICAKPDPSDNKDGGQTTQGADGGTESPDAGTQTPDAGSPDSGMSMECTDIGVCPFGQLCNFAASRCEATRACDPSAIQPGVCGAAGFCNGGVCAQVGKATCSNFMAGVAMYKPRTSTGPVIYKTEQVADDVATCKTGSFAHPVKVYAYRTDADWPQTVADVPGFSFYSMNGTKSGVVPNIRATSGYQGAGTRNAIFTVNFCNATADNAVFGLVFTNGNEICGETGGGTTGTAP